MTATLHHLEKWKALLLPLIIACLIRFPLITTVGHEYDILNFRDWTRLADQRGLFAIYAETSHPVVDHPPLGVTFLVLSTKIFEGLGGSLHNDPRTDLGFLIALKLPPVIFDLLLIVVCYVIVQHQAGVRWAFVCASMLGLAPGLIVDAVWWGQTDSIFGFFLLLTVYALHSRWRFAVWMFYALTLLTKFQGIVLLPLILILVWRRFNIRSLLLGMLVCAIVITVILTPFILSSGARALRPYLKTVNQYPYISIGAHNLWFWVLTPQFNANGQTLGIGGPQDNTVFWGPFSIRTVGATLTACAMFLLAFRAWVYPEQADEFLLAAGLYTAFFMFPTQVHERYLYPTLLLLPLALIRRRIVLLLWVGFTLTFSHNMLSIIAGRSGLWDLIWRFVGWSDYENAFFNIALCLVLFGVLLSPLFKPAESPFAKPRLKPGT